MHGDVNHDSKDKTIIRSYYRCPNKKVKVCETKPINRYKLEELVLEILDRAIFKALDVKELTEAVNQMMRENPETLKQLGRHREALQQKENQSLRLHRSLKFSESDKTTERVMQELDLLEQEQKEIEVKIDKLEAMRRAAYSESEIQEAVLKIPVYIKENRNEAVQGFMNSYIEKILIDNETIEINFQEENKCA